MLKPMVFLKGFACLELSESPLPYKTRHEAITVLAAHFPSKEYGQPKELMNTRIFEPRSKNITDTDALLTEKTMRSNLSIVAYT